MKGYNSVTSLWKRCMEQGMGKEQRASIASLGMLLSQHLHVFINLEALQTQSFWVFMMVLLHRHDWLNHWHWPIHSSSPSPLPTTYGGETESSNRLITWLLLLATGPHPWLLSKSHLTKDTFVARNSKGFRSSVPEMGMKTKYVFLPINHITDTYINKSIIHQGKISTNRTADYKWGKMSEPHSLIKTWPMSIVGAWKFKPN